MRSQREFDKLFSEYMGKAKPTTSKVSVSVSKLRDSISTSDKDERDVELLRICIAKYKWLSKNAVLGIVYGIDECALCLEYNNDTMVFVSRQHCRYCPVERDGHTACVGTPYDMFSTHDMNRSLQGMKAECEKEAKYLQRVARKIINKELPEGD